MTGECATTVNSCLPEAPDKQPLKKDAYHAPLYKVPASVYTEKCAPPLSSRPDTSSDYAIAMALAQPEEDDYSLTSDYIRPESLTPAKKQKRAELLFNNLLAERINTAYILLSMVHEGLHIMDNTGFELYLLSELMAFLPSLRMVTLLIKSAYVMYNTFTKDTSANAKIRSLCITSLCLSGSILAYFFSHVAGPIGLLILMINVIDQGVTLNKVSIKIENKIKELRSNITEDPIDIHKVYFGLCDKEFLKKDHEDKKNKVTIDSLNSIGIAFTIFDSLDAKTMGMLCLICTNILKLYYHYGPHTRIMEEKNLILDERNQVISAEEFSANTGASDESFTSTLRRRHLNRDRDETAPDEPPSTIQPSQTLQN